MWALLFFDCLAQSAKHHSRCDVFCTTLLLFVEGSISTANTSLSRSCLAGFKGYLVKGVESIEVSRYRSLTGCYSACLFAVWQDATRECVTPFGTDHMTKRRAQSTIPVKAIGTKAKCKTKAGGKRVKAAKHVRFAVGPYATHDGHPVHNRLAKRVRFLEQPYGKVITKKEVLALASVLDDDVYAPSMQKLMR
ncbi:hypothetical protein QJQ45_027367, partial [Haematococcus lacustris]